MSVRHLQNTLNKKIILLCTLLLVSYISALDTTWNQVGEINGETVGDEIGRQSSGIAISGDGGRVAIGTYKYDSNGYASGQVRVYQADGTFWNLINAPINGAAFLDYCGWALSLSEDGKRVAIGCVLSRDQGMNAGKVQVYDDDGSTWNQVHSDLYGEANDFFGAFVSLSSDGTRLGIGADHWNGGLGYVRVFEDSGSAWDQVHNDMVAEESGSRMGRSVSLSDDGDVVVAGAYYNKNAEFMSGRLAVFKEESGGWNNVFNLYGTDIGDYLGYASAISGNGDRLVVGAFGSNGVSGITDCGQVEVYEENESGDWVKVHDTIYGTTAQGYVGVAVDINRDGKRIVFSEIGHDENGQNSGVVHIFEDTSTNWTQVYDKIHGKLESDQFGRAVSMSSSGRTVAASSPYKDEAGFNTGQVRMFYDPVDPPPPPPEPIMDPWIIGPAKVILDHDKTAEELVVGTSIVVNQTIGGVDESLTLCNEVEAPEEVVGCMLTGLEVETFLYDCLTPYNSSMVIADKSAYTYTPDNGNAGFTYDILVDWSQLSSVEDDVNYVILNSPLATGDANGNVEGEISFCNKVISKSYTESVTFRFTTFKINFLFDLGEKTFSNLDVQTYVVLSPEDDLNVEHNFAVDIVPCSIDSSTGDYIEESQPLNMVNGVLLCLIPQKLTEVAGVETFTDTSEVMISNFALTLDIGGSDLTIVTYGPNRWQTEVSWTRVNSFNTASDIEIIMIDFLDLSVVTAAGNTFVASGSAFMSWRTDDIRDDGIRRELVSSNLGDRQHFAKIILLSGAVEPAEKTKCLKTIIDLFLLAIEINASNNQQDS